jgi:hypothetical protein
MYEIIFGLNLPITAADILNKAVKEICFWIVERKQVVLEQGPFIRSETIHHIEPTTEF